LVKKQKKTEKRKKPSTVWQEQAGELGDAGRSEKFLKLLGAKKGTSETGYLQKSKKNNSRVLHERFVIRRNLCIYAKGYVF